MTNEGNQVKDGVAWWPMVDGERQASKKVAELAAAFGCEILGPPGV